MFRKFLSALFSRQTLLILAFIVLGAVIWFLGPMSSFGGLYPFASLGARITALLFLAALLLFILFRWPVVILGAVASCLLFWFLGPLLAIGNHSPFASIGARIGVIVFFLFCCLAYGLYRLWVKLRNDEELLNKFLRKSEKEARKDADQQARENLKAVGGIVGRAVAQLRQMHAGGGLFWRLFESKRYLYELPWYMVIGNPGAGKTTAILNSGLKFPLAEQMGRAFQSLGKPGAFAGEGGTKHCDWWFTSEAVMIDTAGRYTTQDSAPRIDSAEWFGFLDLLRKYRAQAPINGAVLVLDAADLADQDKSVRRTHASHLRERLLQLRQKLGIRFPVYVIVTKMDLLEGFEPYFGYLTSESRSQVWGFTLPYRHSRQKTRFPTETPPDLAAQLEGHLSALAERLDAGLALRLQEEPDLERRRALYALPQEFASLGQTLAPFLEEIFLDSPYDATQLHNTLRGVYFTSGLQTDAILHADPRTILQRLWHALRGQEKKMDASSAPLAEETAEREEDSSARRIAAPPRAPQTVTGNRGYFLAELFSRVIFPEASLVRLNLKREARFRTLQLLGHALVAGLAIGSIAVLSASFDHNAAYLETVSGQAERLYGRLLTLFGQPAASQEKDIPGVLDAARDLPRFRELDLSSPPLAFRYGLYAPPPIIDESAEAYAGLQDKLLLPYVIRRLESALREAVRASDEKLAYDTLRVYLQLHDKPRYEAEDVRAWLRKDWENPVHANEFTRRIFVVEHLDRLFSGNREAQSPSPIDASLVRQARAFLDAKPSPQRLYERAKTEMSREAPTDFTLIQAIGPQAGTVFVRASGAPLEQGVPGLFTFDGYRQSFDRRLGEFIGAAREDDEWVMGHRKAGLVEAREKPVSDVRSSSLRSYLTDDTLTQDLRRRYLSEYVEQWDAFLEDIRPVTGTSLGFDLTVVQKLAAPDSPLARLARAAARETTLSREIVRYDPDKGALEKTVETLERQTRDIGRDMGGLRAQARMEREIVDNHFAALREIVTGQPDPGVQMTVRGSQGSAAPASATGMGGIVNLSKVIGMINEFHNQLFMADVALNTNTVPPNAQAAATKLKLDASRLPAPFRNVLMALAGNGDEKITEGSVSILQSQAEIQVERTLASFVHQVNAPCQQGLDGYYPFADSEYDASIEDFTRLFAAGGSADEFFRKRLAPYVDTGARLWRYKNPATLGMDDGMAMPPSAAPVAANAPTLQGEYLKQLRLFLPDPDAFAQIQAIRELFFRDPGAKKMTWGMDFKIIELDPAIVELTINIDGQTQRYAHGPIQVFSVNWPGPRGGTVAEMTASPRVRPDTSAISATGPWAIFRLLDRGKIIHTAHSDRVLAEYDFDGRKALLEIGAGGQQNPLSSGLLRNFRCPGT